MHVVTKTNVKGQRHRNQSLRQASITLVHYTGVAHVCAVMTVLHVSINLWLIIFAWINHFNSYSGCMRITSSQKLISCHGKVAGLWLTFQTRRGNILPGTSMDPSFRWRSCWEVLHSFKLGLVLTQKIHPDIFWRLVHVPLLNLMQTIYSALFLH